MNETNGKNRPPKDKQRSRRRKSEGFPPIMGGTSATSSRNGDDPIGTGRGDRPQENSPGTFNGESSVGGMFSQLIAETKEQIALYENHVVALKSRLEHLREIAGAITTEVESE